MTGSYDKPSAPCCVEHRPKQTTGSMSPLSGRNFCAPNKIKPPLGWVLVVTDLLVARTGQKIKDMLVFLFLRRQNIITQVSSSLRFTPHPCGNVQRALLLCSFMAVRG